MKPRNVLQHLISTGGILLLLAGCGNFAPSPAAILPTDPSVSPTSTNTSMPPTETLLPPTAPDTSILPTETPTPTASTTTNLPFTGSVILEEGRCCIGGFAGDTIQARAAFSAVSPFGKVTSMRVAEFPGCSSESNMGTMAWEPFESSKTFPVPVAINWVGFYLSVQFRDEFGNLSPIYCDDISVEGSPRPPLADPTDWYPQIRCISENQVHPTPGETVTGTSTTFSWPNMNNLPEGVFYKVSAFGAGDGYTALVASGQTRETSITVQIPRDRAGDIVWYITLVDANGTFLNHNRCSSFSASLFTIDPPTGIKGIHFQYQP